MWDMAALFTDMATRAMSCDERMIWKEIILACRIQEISKYLRMEESINFLIKLFKQNIKMAQCNLNSLTMFGKCNKGIICS